MISGRSDKGFGGVTGTVFAIDDVRMLTAAHVCLAILTGQIFGELQQNMWITYLDESGELVEIQDIDVVTLDADKDLCLLRKDGHGLVPLKIADNVEVHDKIMILGAPQGVFPMETEGTVMAIDAKYIDNQLKDTMLLSAPAYGGNSGGPVINEQAEVVGVLVMGSRAYSQISFAVNLKTLKKFIKKKVK